MTRSGTGTWLIRRCRSLKAGICKLDQLRFHDFRRFAYKHALIGPGHLPNTLKVGKIRKGNSTIRTRPGFQQAISDLPGNLTENGFFPLQQTSDGTQSPPAPGLGSI